MLIESSDIEWSAGSRVLGRVVIDIHHEAVDIKNDHLGARITTCDEHLKRYLIRPDCIYGSGVFPHFLTHCRNVTWLRECQ